MSRQEVLLVVDFGSQVTKLILRKTRELGVLSYVCSPEDVMQEVEKHNTKAVIFSGGPESVTQEGHPDVDDKIFDLNLPILGICYGKQLICKKFGGLIESSTVKEFGKADIEILNADTILKDINNKQMWMSRGDRAVSLPEGFRVIAKTENAPLAVVEHEEKQIYGVQFHPEVHHSIEGARILDNFLNIAGFKKDWKMFNYKEEEIKRIRKQIGNKKAICALSGGVDSSVAAVMVHEAIRDNLKCIFVDNGLLRKGEREQVETTFKKHFHIDLITVDARQEFYDKLKRIDDPEKKRKIIGELFIEIFDRESKRLKGESFDPEFLVQGTIYPDVIESSAHSKGSHTIKSHHNVGGLPDTMKLKLVEPLRELFKDEVRKLGMELGITKDVIMRHPFPGPGLAIRILGDITEEKVRILQNADNIYINELKNHGLYDKIWQAFCVLLPCRTVGVMGDGRTYDYVLAIRAVNSVDGMTADFYPFEMDFLSHLSRKIVNEVQGINRVTYDVTSKPPATIEWE